MTLEEIKQKEPFFGKWRIVGRLGAGSYGEVYKIKYVDYNGKEYYSALKVISIPKDEDELAEVGFSCGTLENTKSYYEEQLKKLQNEIELMSQFRGKTNIVSYEDHDIIPKTGENAVGFDVLVRMELLEDLRSVQRSRPALLNNQIEIIRIGKDICTALEVCRTHYIIHRDIKPGNIMRSADGDYELGDFGVARSLENDSSMTRVGTLTYMAPEVEQGSYYDQRADIYSLGMVLYELLNGNRGPFLPPGNQKITSDDKMNARLRCLRGDELPLPSRADPRLGEVVKKACAFRPEDRYATAGEFRNELELAEKQMLGLVSGAAAPAADVRSAAQDAAERTERTERTERPERTERTERAERTDRAERAEGTKRKKSRTGVLVILILFFFVLLLLLIIGICGVPWIAREADGIGDAASDEADRIVKENVPKTRETQDTEETQDTGQQDGERSTEETPETETPETETPETEAGVQDEVVWGGDKVLGASESQEIHRYVIVREDVTWKGAFARSREYDNGYLAHIDSSEEFAAIIQQIEAEGYGDETYFFWLGGRRYNDEADYYWVDIEGSRVGGSLNDSPYWLEGEPSYESDGETERYMNMFRGQEDDYIWNDVPNDLAALSSYYSGRIAYIVEIED